MTILCAFVAPEQRAGLNSAGVQENTRSIRSARIQTPIYRIVPSTARIFKCYTQVNHYAKDQNQYLKYLDSGYMLSEKLFDEE